MKEKHTMLYFIRYATLRGLYAGVLLSFLYFLPMAAIPTYYPILCIGLTYGGALGMTVGAANGVVLNFVTQAFPFNRDNDLAYRGVMAVVAMIVSTILVWLLLYLDLPLFSAREDMSDSFVNLMLILTAGAAVFSGVVVANWHLKNRAIEAARGK